MSVLAICFNLKSLSRPIGLYLVSSILRFPQHYPFDQIIAYICTCFIILDKLFLTLLFVKILDVKIENVDMLVMVRTLMCMSGS